MALPYFIWIQISSTQIGSVSTPTVKTSNRIFRMYYDFGAFVAVAGVKKKGWELGIRLNTD